MHTLFQNVLKIKLAVPWKGEVSLDWIWLTLNSFYSFPSQFFPGLLSHTQLILSLLHLNCSLFCVPFLPTLSFHGCFSSHCILPLH